MSRQGNSRLFTIASFALLVAWAILTILPLYWMLVTSVTDAQASVSLEPSFLPRNPSIAPYLRFLARGDAPRWLLNSLIVATAITVANVFFSTLAGYAFAKLKFPGKDLIFWCLMATLMLPGQVTLIPLYVLVMNKFFLGDTYAALILPFVCTINNIFLMKQYMTSLPTSILESARIDSCSEFGLFWRIVVPIAKPGLAVVAIFTFVANWNQFFWPLLVTSSSKMRTIQVGLSAFRFSQVTDYGAMMAGSVIASLPIILLFFALQRYFLQGVTVGAVKG